jgi:predicted enzyme related to lactoylglutathione lyase
MKPNYSLLYVESPEASARLYADLLDLQPMQSAPTFFLFALADGRMLGLWERASVKPALPAGAIGVGGEIGFRLESRAAVDAAYAGWRARGLSIIQTPEQVDFGYTFVAADPDGHRLRVFARTN